MTVSMFFEGLPGAGKTELMVALATILGEDCLAVPETNPTRSQLIALSRLPADEVNRWYLQQELRRDRLAASLAPLDHPRLVVFDRSYLSVLAYCHAKSAITGVPGYEHARAFFGEAIRPHLSPSSTVQLLTISVEVSLARRHDKQDREFEPDWYRRDFLAAQDEFYRDLISDQCAGQLCRSDSQDRAQAETLGAVLSAVGCLDLVPSMDSMPVITRGRGDEIEEAPFRRYFYSNGGIRVFGQPVGRAVRHHGGYTQFFERHALQLDASGEVSLFEPLAGLGVGEIG